MVAQLLPVQCKMARVALGIGVRELAQMASLSSNTVSRLERGEELRESTLVAIRTAFERAGVAFIDGDGPGVKLAKKGK